MTPDELRQAVLDLCAQNQKINAIKLYREQTGKGLADAKHDVEALAAGTMHAMPPLRAARLVATGPGPTGQGGGPSTHVAELIRAGKKIDAIRAHRLQTGLGLAEAKNAVEAMEAAMMGAPPPTFGASPATFGDIAKALDAPPAFGGSGSALGASGSSSSGSSGSSAFGASGHVPRAREGSRFASDDLTRDGRGPSALVLGLVFVALAGVALSLVVFLYGR